MLPGKQKKGDCSKESGELLETSKEKAPCMKVLLMASFGPHLFLATTCFVPLCLQRSERMLLPYLRYFLSNRWVWKILDLPGFWDSHRCKEDDVVGASLHRIRYSTCGIL